jgi:hypothetical protein
LQEKLMAATAPPPNIGEKWANCHQRYVYVEDDRTELFLSC